MSPMSEALATPDSNRGMPVKPEVADAPTEKVEEEKKELPEV